LDHVMDRVGDFGDDNRAGIERTLHRISGIRNRKAASSALLAVWGGLYSVPSRS
jgi:stage III sporulation protein SpoIIIAA